MKSIKTRLNFSMAALILFFIAQAAAVVWFVNYQRQEVTEKVQRNTLASSQLADLSTLAQQIRRYEKEYFVYVQNEERRNGYIKEFSDTSGKIDKLIDEMLKNTKLAYSKAELEEVYVWRNANAFYVAEMKSIFETVKRTQLQIAADTQKAVLTSSILPSPIKTIALSPASIAIVGTAPVVSLPTPSEANDMIKAGKDRFSAELIKGVAAQSKAKTQATLGLADVTAATYTRLLTAVLVTVSLGISIAIYLMLKLPGTITQPIARLSDLADDIARGNLDKPFPKETVAEFDPLAKSLEKMRVGLAVLTRKMKARAAAEVL